MASQMHTRIRLATTSDVPHIHNLIHQLAVSEDVGPYVKATPAALSATLFPSSPPPRFSSPTVFLLELSPSQFTPTDPTQNMIFAPVLKSLHHDSLPITDPEKEAYSTDNTHDVSVGGFVLFYPNYNMFLAKTGFHIEGLFVRECYRRKGLGTMLISAVAAEAAKMGHGRVQWDVSNSNMNAIKLYEKMGAKIDKDHLLCRLSGEALQAHHPDHDHKS